MWLTALAVAFGSGLPVVAAELETDRGEGVPTDASLVRTYIGWESLRGGDEAMVPNGGNPRAEPAFEHKASGPTGVEQSIKERAADDVTNLKVAQFQLPKHKEQMFRRRGIGDPPSPLIQFLKFEYSYGSESEINYRKNPDLNNRVQDVSLIATPEVNGFIRYRPTDWLEATLEMIFDKEIAVQEEDSIVLPDGEIQISPDREFSLLVDQLYVTIKGFTAPFEFTVGRRNFEDERHWLYDTSLDGAVVTHKQGKFRTEAFIGREVLTRLDALKKQRPDRINTFMLYTEYRGIENIKLAAYTIFRDDRDGKEGRPLHIGVRSQGTPSMNFSYWAEFAYLLHKDIMSRRFEAFAFDVGGTYRFPDLPLNPNVTLGFAFATGDDPGNDDINNEFRQTGLQSNEAKFAGVSEFKTYGEVLDPELSNLRILTVGLGFRPVHSVSVDFVYHDYWLNEIADEIRNSALTAQMNQDATRRSRDVGSAFDIVIGLRNLFGVRRLGLDLRGGWFFPGRAFRIEEGDENFRGPDRGFTTVVKFWW